ncbi:MAG: DUF6614 family protein [Polyangiaceae bacterium]
MGDHSGDASASVGALVSIVAPGDLRQLEAAFERVGARREPTEKFHFGVNSFVTNVRFALYRDFPDEFRHRGEERF